MLMIVLGTSSGSTLTSINDSAHERSYVGHGLWSITVQVEDKIINIPGAHIDISWNEKIQDISDGLYLLNECVW